MKKEKIKILMTTTLPDKTVYSKGVTIELELLKEEYRGVIEHIPRSMFRGAWVLLMVHYESEKYLKEHGYLTRKGKIASRVKRHFKIEHGILKQRGYK